MFARTLTLPAAGTDTFFLWGPRQTGKSTLLRQRFGDAFWVDLLKADELRRYAVRPESLRQELEASDPSPRQVVIDEVQKVPALLDEVHWLMENRGQAFCLCGSSARKVRRGAANLLGGRALRFELLGLTARELGEELNFDRLLNVGYLPRIYTAGHPQRLLESYVADYLREEIAAEGLTRNLPAFANFLEAAALTDGEIVNYTNLASDCGTAATTIKGYFEILEDTLIGHWLPAWRSRTKRRLVAAPKFYLADVGVVNRLARRSTIARGSELYGKAFENWLFHELRAFVQYTGFDGSLAYWRLSGGLEVDFILGDMALAVEAKASANLSNRHLKGLRKLGEDYPDVRRVAVCLDERARRTEDGIDILPAEEFVRRLWDGGLTD